MNNESMKIQISFFRNDIKHIGIIAVKERALNGHCQFYLPLNDALSKQILETEWSWVKIYDMMGNRLYEFDRPILELRRTDIVEGKTNYFYSLYQDGFESKIKEKDYESLLRKIYQSRGFEY